MEMYRFPLFHHHLIHIIILKGRILSSTPIEKRSDNRRYEERITHHLLNIFAIESIIAFILIAIFIGKIIAIRMNFSVSILHRSNQRAQTTGNRASSTLLLVLF